MGWIRSTFSAGRFCAHCGLTLLCWLLWLGLALLLAALLYVATSRELPVPAFVLRQFEARLEASGVHARFGTTAFDPSGRILIQDFALYSPPFDSPLLTCRALYVRLNPWALLAGSFDPRAIRLSGANLFVPAMLSPSGASEPLVRDLDASLEEDGRTLRLDQLVFLTANLRVTAHGTIRLPAAAPAGPRALPLATLLGRYVKISRQLLTFADRLRVFDQPALNLTLNASETRAALADLNFTAAGVHLGPADLAAFIHSGPAPAALNVTRLRATATLPLGGAAPYFAAATFAADALDAPGLASAAGVGLRATASINPRDRTAALREVRLTAATLAARGLRADDVSADAVFTAPARLSGDLEARLVGSPLHLAGRADLRARTADLRLDGRLTPGLLNAAAALRGRNLATQLVLGEPPALRAEATFAPGWKLSHAGGWLRAHDVDAHNVPLNTVSARLDLTGADFRATDIVLRQGGNLALGSYADNLATRDFRILLRGRLRPHGIDGWFKEWWPDFWDNFDFTNAAPKASVDIQGQWRDPSQLSVFCYADAAGPSLHGVPFDRIRTRLFVRPEFYDVFEFIAEHGAHAARGGFICNLDVNSGDLSTFDFHAVSTLDLADSARLFGDDGIHLLAPYHFDVPPTLTLSGHADSLASSALNGPRYTVDMAVASTGRFTLRGFPVNDLSFTGRIVNGDLTLDRISAGFAGGVLAAHARVFGPDSQRRLAFDGALTNADLSAGLRIYNEFRRREQSGEPPLKSKFLEDSNGGRLNASLAAEGGYGDLLNYHGQGRADITGAKLGEINLLGLLSELLNHTLLNFTSLTLDTAHTAFEVNGPAVSFPYLKITGPSAVVDATGKFSLADKSLDFNATIHPFEQSGFLPANLVGLVLSPLSRVLKVKLIGTLDRPDWVFVYGPTNFLRALTNGAPPGETAPANSAPLAPSFKK